MTIELNSKESLEQMQARAEMQEKHLEEKYGRLRQLEVERADTFVNHAVINWILTLHDFSGKAGMDYLNAVNSMFMVHLNSLEDKVKKMEEALGEDKLRELGIDPDYLYPSVVASRGLLDVQEAARARAKANKYMKLSKENKRIIS